MIYYFIRIEQNQSIRTIFFLTIACAIHKSTPFKYFFLSPVFPFIYCLLWSERQPNIKNTMRPTKNEWKTREEVNSSKTICIHRASFASKILFLSSIHFSFARRPLQFCCCHFFYPQLNVNVGNDKVYQRRIEFDMVQITWISYIFPTFSELGCFLSLLILLNNGWRTTNLNRVECNILNIHWQNTMLSEKVNFFLLLLKGTHTKKALRQIEKKNKMIS